MIEIFILTMLFSSVVRYLLDRLARSNEDFKRRYYDPNNQLFFNVVRIAIVMVLTLVIYYARHGTL